MMPANQTHIVHRVRESGHVISREAMPEDNKQNISQLIYREVREFFSDASVMADYEKWLVEYQKNH